MTDANEPFFEVGDYALNKNNQLDSREVTRVVNTPDGGQHIWLFMLTQEHGPFDADDYTNVGRR